MAVINEFYVYYLILLNMNAEYLSETHLIDRQ